jgi:predicted RNA-binding Zn-ribbon protein involved in translation (DUF1610 family)
VELCFAKTLFHCPNCESEAIRRSKRRGFVERVFLRAALVWPYRCDDCDQRFWGFQRAVPGSIGTRDLRPTQATLAAAAFTKS